MKTKMLTLVCTMVLFFLSSFAFANDESKTALNATISNENESQLTLEEWMFDGKVWNTKPEKNRFSHTNHFNKDTTKMTNFNKMYNFNREMNRNHFKEITGRSHFGMTKGGIDMVNRCHFRGEMRGKDHFRGEMRYFDKKMSKKEMRQHIK